MDLFTLFAGFLPLIISGSASASANQPVTPAG